MCRCGSGEPPSVCFWGIAQYCGSVRQGVFCPSFFSCEWVCVLGCTSRFFFSYSSRIVVTGSTSMSWLRIQKKWVSFRAQHNYSSMREWVIKEKTRGKANTERGIVCQSGDLLWWGNFLVGEDSRYPGPLCLLVGGESIRYFILIRFSSSMVSDLLCWSLYRKRRGHSSEG